MVLYASGHGKEDNLILRVKKNGKLVVMSIHSKLRKVLERLKDVGPVEAEPHTNKFLKDVATMAEIDKHITCHVSRHTFGTRYAELGISIETTAELLGITVKVCQVYYKVTRKKIGLEMKNWG